MIIIYLYITFIQNYQPTKMNLNKQPQPQKKHSGRIIVD